MCVNYKNFCDKYQPTKKELIKEFYFFFNDKFGIKNERLAVEKLKKILDATFKLSSKQSFANMSLRQLSLESGLSMGGLYAYIKNKKQLSIFIHEFLSYFVIKTINTVTNKKGCNTLECIVKTHIFLSEFMLPWFFFAFLESKNLSKQERELAKKSELIMENKLIEVIKEGQKEETYNVILKAETVAALIKPLLSEWYLKRWKYKKRDISIDEYAYAVMIFIERGLTSPHSLTEFGENTHDR